MADRSSQPRRAASFAAPIPASVPAVSTRRAPKADNTDSTEPKEKIETADPNEPTDPTDSTEPADPTDKIDPTDPIDRIEPADPTDKIDPADPTDRIDPELSGIFGRSGLIGVTAATSWWAIGSSSPTAGTRSGHPTPMPETINRCEQSRAGSRAPASA